MVGPLSNDDRMPVRQRTEINIVRKLKISLQANRR